MQSTEGMFGPISGTGLGPKATGLGGKAEINKSTFGTVDVSQVPSLTQKPQTSQPTFGGATVTTPATFGSLAA